MASLAPATPLLPGNAPDHARPAQTAGASRHRDAAAGPIRARTVSAISPGLACRPSRALEKMSSPSRETSKRPLDDGTSSIEATTGAHPPSNSSARPTA